VLESEVTLNMAGLTLLQKNLQGSIFGHGNPARDMLDSRNIRGLIRYTDADR
jgi:S-(hydroxymethyl)glutathione dehydrogenase/alcohol dehydrogenase